MQLTFCDAVIQLQGIVGKNAIIDDSATIWDITNLIEDLQSCQDDILYDLCVDVNGIYGYDNAGYRQQIPLYRVIYQECI